MSDELRETTIDGRTDRQGGGAHGASAAVEVSSGTSSVSVQAFTHSNLGLASEFDSTDGESGLQVMPGGGHGFEPGDLPDAYGMENTIVETSSTMKSIGFTQAAGDDNDIAASSHADYVSTVTDNSSTRDLGEVWAFKDEEGELGASHRYTLTTNNQSGTRVMHYLSGTNSNNQNSASTGGIDRVSHLNRTMNSDLSWLHQDTAIYDDGALQRTVRDCRSTDHDETTNFSRSGGAGHASFTGSLSNAGRATANIVTTWTGGGLAGVWQQDARQVSDPDSITQHVTLEGENHVSADTVYQDDSGGPFGRLMTFDRTAAFEYDLDYNRPAPPPEEGEEGGGSEIDDGVTFNVVDYQIDTLGHGLDTDGSPEEQRRNFLADCLRLRCDFGQLALLVEIK